MLQTAVGRAAFTRFVEIVHLAQLHFLFRMGPFSGRAGGAQPYAHPLGSGTVDDPTERFFVLGAVSVFERGLFHQIKLVDECVREFNLGDPHEIELHASAMYAGRDRVWRSVRHRPARETMIRKALATLQGHASVRLFAIVIDKAAVSPRDPVEMAFEEICNRFNLFLTRTNDRRGNEDHRGLIVMDESKHEKPLQMLARKFRIDGARWGHFRKLAEVPLFIDSRASRMIQLADLVAWSTFRKYEIQDGRFFDPLIRLFDAHGGVIHGLVHHKSRAEDCYCAACLSRGKRDTVPRVSITREKLLIGPPEE
jgi:hypothetical protein